MGNLSIVVRQLKKEHTRLTNELHRVTVALTAFGKAYLNGRRPTAVTRKKRTLSVAARKKIAAAQRARWKVWRAKQKKAA